MDDIVAVVCFYNQVDLIWCPYKIWWTWRALFSWVEIYTPDLIRVAQNQWDYVRIPVYRFTRSRMFWKRGSIFLQSSHSMAREPCFYFDIFDFLYNINQTCLNDNFPMLIEILCEYKKNELMNCLVYFEQLFKFSDEKSRRLSFI